MESTSTSEIPSGISTAPPRTSYSQLMVATHKAESENKEIWDKVWARAAVITDSEEGTTEQGQQIA